MDRAISQSRRKGKSPRPTRASGSEIEASQYLATVLSGEVVAVEPPPSSPLSGEVFPPLPESQMPRTVDEFVTRITDLWEDAQQRFLRIGELLTIAAEQLTTDEQAVLYETLNRRFGKSARSQLMSAYRAIRANIVPSEMAAAGYVTVYTLARLSEEERRQAAAAGLMRPDVRQSDVRAFFSAKRSGRSKTATRSSLEARRARLVAEIARIDAELARLEGEFS